MAKREPLHNTFMTCQRHSARPDPQYFDKPLEWFFLKHVKICFPIPNSKRYEHMWVLVLGPGVKAELWGTLANDSIFVLEWECGTYVELNRSQIEAVDVDDL